YSQSEINQPFLPKPTGVYQIGTTELFLTDSSRKDRFKKKDFRRIYVKIWYPAQPAQEQKPELYLENYPSDLIIDIFHSKDFSAEWLEEIKKKPTHSYFNAPLDSRFAEYPMLIFTPGYYFGMAELYSAFMEELASHGYIVCSVNHPYEQPYIKFPNNDEVFIKKKRTQWAYLQLVMANWFQFRKKDSPENIEKITRYYHQMLHRFDKALGLWVEDTEFFVDHVFQEKNNTDAHQIIAAINLEQIGAFGQSFGGAVTGQLCLVDERVKAGLNMDCFQFGDIVDYPLNQPFMLMQSDYQPTWNMGNTINYKNNIGDFSLLSIPNASHFIFSDGAVLPYHSQEFKNRMIGEIDGHIAMENINAYMLDFFNFYVKKKEASLIFEDIKNEKIEYFYREGEKK
ncbi:MAG: hypothetical protein GQ527_00585, partial [Bacteroidales bacterium]|nr:hypothetical protein [Bacteroidales bacterium]